MTTPVWVRTAVGLAIVVALASACGGDSGPAAADDPTAAETASATSHESAKPAPEPEPVPWEAVESYRSAPRGEYTMDFTMNQGVRQASLMQEYTRFDLGVPFMHYQFVRRPTEQPPADSDTDTTASYIQTDTVVLLSSPSAEAACGAPWVDLTHIEGDSDDLPGPGGLPESPTVVPLDVLGMRIGEPEHLSTTADASVYEVVLPADAGFAESGSFQQDPEMLDVLSTLRSVAEVRLPRDGGPLTMTIDFTEVYATIRGREFPAGTTLQTVWTIDTGIEPFDTSLPSEVADARCLDSTVEG